MLWRVISILLRALMMHRVNMRRVLDVWMPQRVILIQRLQYRMSFVHTLRCFMTVSATV